MSKNDENKVQEITLTFKMKRGLALHQIGFTLNDPDDPGMSIEFGGTVPGCGPVININGISDDLDGFYVANLKSIQAELERIIEQHQKPADETA